MVNWLKRTGFNLFVFVIIQVFNIVKRQNLIRFYTFLWTFLPILCEKC